MLVAVVQSSIMLAAAIAMYFVPFHWWIAPLYLLAIYLGFVDRVILATHNRVHRKLFRARWARVVEWWMDWVLGPVFGLPAHTYAAHHIAMHHREGNGFDDLSSTRRFQRDSILGFAKYVGRFLFFIHVDMSRYLWKRKTTRRHIVKMLTGEGVYLASAVLLAFVSWKPTLVVFAPFVITRFLLMAGNWGQHAFVADGGKKFAWGDSTTCLDARLNRRGFNDGYHGEHHRRPEMHFTEYPAAFEKHAAEYEKQGAIVLRDIDFVGVWFLLMCKRYGRLAELTVNAGLPKPATREEIAAELRRRARERYLPA